MVRYSFGERLTRLSDGEDRKEDEDVIAIMTMDEFKTAEDPVAYRKVLAHTMEHIHYCKAETFGLSDFS